MSWAPVVSSPTGPKYTDVGIIMETSKGFEVPRIIMSTGLLSLNAITGLTCSPGLDGCSGGFFT